MTVIEYLAQYGLVIKDFIPCLSALVAGSLTVGLVVLNNRKTIAGQVETQKELLKHQSEHLQKQLDHDLKKHNAQLELEKRQIYYENIHNKNKIIVDFKKDKIIESRILLSNYISIIHKIVNNLIDLAHTHNKKLRTNITQENAKLYEEKSSKLYELYENYEFALFESGNRLMLHLDNQPEIAKKIQTIYNLSTNIYNKINISKQKLTSEEFCTYQDNVFKKFDSHTTEIKNLFNEYLVLTEQDIISLFNNLEEKITKSEKIMIKNHN